MLKCFFTRRKLYDYLDNALSDSDTREVRRHLDACSGCAKKLTQMADLLKLAANKNAPAALDAFWHNFKSELDQKLNQRLVPKFNLKTAPARKLKPAWAFSFISLCILIISVSLLFNLRSRPILLTESEAELADEAIFLDELDSASSLNHSEDAYLDELDLFNQLGVSISSLG